MLLEVNTKRKNGYAMVSTLALSAILILAVGVMVYKINSNTKDIVRAKLNSQALNVAEEGIEHVINWLNVQNTSTQNPPSLNTLLATNLNLSGVIYSNNVFKSVKDSGEFEIQMNPTGIATSNEDYIEIKSIGYVPSKVNFKAKKIVTAIIKRPLVSNLSIKEAVLSGGDINMGNGDTDSGTTPNPTTFTAEGDIHSNKSISLGPNSDINGNASAVLGISNSNKVTGTATPNAQSKPIPSAKYKIDSTPCVMTIVGNKKMYAPPLGKEACTYTGNLPASANDKVMISGTVYVTGSISAQGQTTFESVGTLAKLIVENDVGFGGNASATPLTSRLMVVSRNGNVTISGNGTVYGIVFQENPNKSVTFNGQGNNPIGLFGAIISSGGVNINGQVSVIRDLTLSSMDLVNDPNGRIVKVQSWRMEN
jgi:hypothetical protein